MGLEIGYHLYEKEPLIKEGKFVEAPIEPSFVCGRCDVNYSWGELFKFESTKETCPVFQKDLKDRKDSLEEYSIEFNYVDFEDFKDIVTRAIKETKDKGNEEMMNLILANKKDKEKIKELRDLQKECTKDQEFAFNKWTEEIKELQEFIDNRTDYYNNFKEEDYDYSHAFYVENLLEEMETYLKEDKYFVVPYYSY